MATSGISDALSSAGNLMVWLGGGSWRDIDDEAERSTYQTTGFVVALNAIIAWAVATFAVVSLSGVSAWAAMPFTLVCGVLVGAFGRIMASAAGGRGLRRAMGDAAKAMIAVLIGIMVGELAALAIFSGPIERELAGQVDMARASVATGDRARQLEQLRDDRAALDERVSAALQRRDEALIVARCEYNPTPGCPSNRITGDRGRGQAADLAAAELANAESEVAAAREDRLRRAPTIGAAIERTEAELEADREEAEALARADNGLDARWRAMHAHTTDTPSAMILRVGVVGLAVLLNLLPLLLRIWRGQTGQDRRIEARRLRHRAEEDADTAIALKRAEVRTARELRRQEELLQPPPIAIEPAIDMPPREIAATAATVAPASPEPAALEPAEEAPSDDANLPAKAATSALQPRPSGPLDVLPGPLPQVARAVGSLVWPRVPGPVARIAGNPTNPIKTIRTILDEVEELQFTVLRRRRVTYSEEIQEEPGEAPAAGEATPPRRRVVATTVREPAPRTELDDAGLSGPALPPPEHRRELPPGPSEP